MFSISNIGTFTVTLFSKNRGVLLMNRITNRSAYWRAFQLAATLLFASSLAACGGGGGSGNTVLDTAGTALFTSSPAAITVAAGTSVEHTIGGGGGGSKFTSYKATTSDSNVATASVVGTKLTIAAISGGTVSVTVSDSVGATVVIAVTVPVSTVNKLTINAPASLTLSPGMNSTYKIAGGIGPFTAVSSNPFAASAETAGSSLLVTASNSGPATIVVYDAVGASAQVAITVSGSGTPVALYSTAPSTVTLQKGMTSAPYTINGGVAPYIATSSDVATVGAQLTGNSLTLTGAALGLAKIAVVDAVGTLLNINVVVTGDLGTQLYTTAPSNIQIEASQTPRYTIVGGRPPYVVSTSNPSVAKAAITNADTLTVTGVGTGVADVVVFDSAGAIVRIVATVGGGTGVVPLYTTAPDSITVMAGAAPTYTIAGGAGPYVVTSSAVSVATVSQSGNMFTVKGVASGNGAISVHDANGSALVIIVTVQ